MVVVVVVVVVIIRNNTTNPIVSNSESASFSFINQREILKGTSIQCLGSPTSNAFAAVSPDPVALAVCKKEALENVWSFSF